MGNTNSVDGSSYDVVSEDNKENRDRGINIQFLNGKRFNGATPTKKNTKNNEKKDRKAAEDGKSTEKKTMTDGDFRNHGDDKAMRALKDAMINDETNESSTERSQEKAQTTSTEIQTCSKKASSTNETTLKCKNGATTCHVGVHGDSNSKERDDNSTVKVKDNSTVKVEEKAASSKKVKNVVQTAEQGVITNEDKENSSEEAINDLYMAMSKATNEARGVTQELSNIVKVFKEEADEIRKNIAEVKNEVRDLSAKVVSNKDKDKSERKKRGSTMRRVLPFLKDKKMKDKNKADKLLLLPTQIDEAESEIEDSRDHTNVACERNDDEIQSESSETESTEPEFHKEPIKDAGSPKETFKVPEPPKRRAKVSDIPDKLSEKLTTSEPNNNSDTSNDIGNLILSKVPTEESLLVNNPTLKMEKPDEDSMKHENAAQEATEKEKDKDGEVLKTLDLLEKSLYVEENGYDTSEDEITGSTAN